MTAGKTVSGAERASNPTPHVTAKSHPIDSLLKLKEENAPVVLRKGGRIMNQYLCLQVYDRKR